MAHFNFVISQNAKWGYAGFYIDCHRMTVPENILLQKSTADDLECPLTAPNYPIFCILHRHSCVVTGEPRDFKFCTRVGHAKS